jgi:hypothetical protein
MVLQELHTEEDRVVTLECVSRGGKPPAEVSKLLSPSTRLASSLVRAPKLLTRGEDMSSIPAETELGRLTNNLENLGVRSSTIIRISVLAELLAT